MSTARSRLRALRGSNERLRPRRSVMLRDLSGEIRSWDRNSEIVYGFKKSQALGFTSHRLLKTIFPEPLTRINQRLENARKWRGELIHTCVDGRQVKVVSEWEVIEIDNYAPLIRETNAMFVPLAPETAQLSESSLSVSDRELENLRRSEILRYFGVSLLVSTVLLILAWTAAWVTTHGNGLHPIP